MPETNEKPRVTVTATEAGEDPSIPIYHVEIIRGRGLWRETFGCSGELKAFLCGITAGCAMLGVHIKQPKLPRETL